MSKNILNFDIIIGEYRFQREKGLIMKHKIFTGLVCSISILGLAACGTKRGNYIIKGRKSEARRKTGY